jgi:hypothetical protein
MQRPNLERSNGHSYRLVIRVADADADLLEANALGFLVSDTMELECC